MKRKITIAAIGSSCGSVDRLTIPQMRGMLQLVQDSVDHDVDLREVGAHLRAAVACLDELREAARDVMVEVDAERAAAAGRHGAGTMKPCRART